MEVGPQDCPAGDPEEEEEEQPDAGASQAGEAQEHSC